MIKDKVRNSSVYNEDFCYLGVPLVPIIAAVVYVLKYKNHWGYHIHTSSYFYSFEREILVPKDLEGGGPRMIIGAGTFNKVKAKIGGKIS